MTILAMLLALHNLYPSLRPYTQPFFQLSYYNESSNSYVQGWTMSTSSSVLPSHSPVSALSSLNGVLQPLARACGLKRKESIRIAEQGLASYVLFVHLGNRIGRVWPTDIYLGLYN
jgi:hypothetical protein